MAASSIIIKDGNGSNQELATDVTGAVHTPKHIVSGPLTDDELRASAIEVDGPLTDDELRATPVPVSGPATNAELRLTPLAVTGPVTNTQMRATPLDVAGPVTNAELRASAVSVTEKSNNELPITAGVYPIIAEADEAITVPAGATGVRLYAVTKNVLFQFDSAPAAPVASTLGAGGLAIAGQLRVLRFPSAVTTLNLLSTEPALGAATDIAVEFFGV